MRRTLALSTAALTLTVLLASSGEAGAAARPEIIAGLGGTFATTGTPDGGGLSSSLTMRWPVGERGAFGVRAFADDIGTQQGRLRDPNDGTDLGTTALTHRWSYGATWRGDYALHRGERWGGGVTGDWGYWRIEDDSRGQLSSAVSAVGFVLGGSLDRTFGATNTGSLVLRYHRIFTDRDVAPNLVGRYASAAIEWSWKGADRR